TAALLTSLPRCDKLWSVAPNRSKRMRFSPPRLIAALFIARASLAAATPLVLDLWPDKKVPDETGTIGAEYVRPSPKLDRKQGEVTESTRLVTNVTKPSITIYRPAKEKDTGTSILICPGGGYWNLYWELEGEEVATWLKPLGVTGI